MNGSVTSQLLIGLQDNLDFFAELCQFCGGFFAVKMDELCIRKVLVAVKVQKKPLVSRSDG